MPYKFLDSGLTLNGKVMMQGDVVDNLPANLVARDVEQQIARYGRIMWIEVKEQPQHEVEVVNDKVDEVIVPETFIEEEEEEEPVKKTKKKSTRKKSRIASS
jgi:hypothetical protein